MRTRKILIKDPSGNLFNAADANGVDKTDTGILIVGGNRRILHFVKTADATNAELWRDELVKVVEEATEGRKYQPTW